MPRMHRGGFGHGHMWGRGGFLLRFIKMFTILPRMAIIQILARGDSSSGEIYDILRTEYGLEIPRSLLYYHLDALENIGIIELKEYRESGRGGAPEKVWRLKVKRVILDFGKGSLLLEGDEGVKEYPLLEF